MTSVGFIGLGRMGSPMAANVAKAGFPLTVYNRSEQKSRDLAQRVGASFAATPRQCADGADVIITMLADEGALRNALEGSDGILAGLRPGAVVVDMGTTGPDAVKALAGAIAAAGGTMVDAPVSGSTAAAEAATLTLMVGGPDEAVDKALPVLEAMSSTIFRLGGTGAGAAMKLAVNLVIFGLTQAVAEGLVLAESAGIAREAAYEVFENSAIAAPMVKYRHDAFVHPDQTPAAFALTLAAKDLRLILDLAYEVSAPVPQAAVNLEVAQQAILSGLGDADIAGLADFLRSLKH